MTHLDRIFVIESVLKSNELLKELNTASVDFWGQHLAAVSAAIKRKQVHT